MTEEEKPTPLPGSVMRSTMVEGVPDKVATSYQQRGHLFVCPFCPTDDRAKTTLSFSGMCKHVTKFHRDTADAGRRQRQIQGVDRDKYRIDLRWPQLAVQWNPPKGKAAGPRKPYGAEVPAAVVEAALGNKKAPAPQDAPDPGSTPYHRLREAAFWLSAHPPGTPVPDWVDRAMNDPPPDDGRGHAELAIEKLVVVDKVELVNLKLAGDGETLKGLLDQLLTAAVKVGT